MIGMALIPELAETVAHRALAEENTSHYVLELIFDRLYVLQNQILHGGATWSGSVNRDQVRDGAAIMGFLVPCIRERDDGPPG